jgi:hypothetical protein
LKAIHILGEPDFLLSDDDVAALCELVGDDVARPFRWALDHDMHVIKTGISTEAAVLKALAHDCPERLVELRAALVRNRAAGAELVRRQQLELEQRQAARRREREKNQPG